jgi:hypothetical protein
MKRALEEPCRVAQHDAVIQDNSQRLKFVCPGLSKFKIGASHRPSSAAPLLFAGVSLSLLRISDRVLIL